MSYAYQFQQAVEKQGSRISSRLMQSMDKPTHEDDIVFEFKTLNTNEGLTIDKIKRAKALLEENAKKPFKNQILVSPNQLEALFKGEVGTYEGFKFVDTSWIEDEYNINIIT